MSKPNKHREKGVRSVVTRGQGVGRGGWMKVVRRYKLPVMREMSPGGIVQDAVNKTNTAVC